MQTVFDLPAETNKLQRQWWFISDAASAWRCSYRTAWRRMTLMDEVQLLTLYRSRGTKRPLVRCKCSFRWAVPAGSVSAPQKCGNPNFTQSDYQRQLANRRWASR